MNLNVPYEVGQTVYYITKNPAYPYIKCLIKSIKLESDGWWINLESTDCRFTYISILWIKSCELGKSVFISEQEVRAAIGNIDSSDINLYKAIAYYNLDSLTINFSIDNIAIDHIGDDYTISTANYHVIENGHVTNKFAGPNCLHTDQEIQIGNNDFIYYSTNKLNCISFIYRHFNKLQYMIDAITLKLNEFKSNMVTY